MASKIKSKIAVINGNIFHGNKFKKGSILIHDDKIFKITFKNNSKEKLDEYKIIDAEDSYVSYGFFDPHVHFRVPGSEYKEDWKSGGKAAIKGGFTYVADMPNNNPAAVDVKTMETKHKLASDSVVNHGFYIGLTDDNAGHINKYIKKIKKKKINILGIKVFLGSSTGDLLVKKRNTIHKGLKSGYMNLYHCEDEDVLNKYNYIPYNSIFNHEKKRPSKAAESGIKKILKANEKNKKSKIYICHVSTRKEIKIIKKYRKKGYKIIAEITPHHLFFYLPKIMKSNVYKVNPPIRQMEDVLEIRKEFNKGFFQVIGTDHAPHKIKEKNSDNPPSGFPGLESAFYALYSLYEHNNLSLKMVFKLLTNGYNIFQIKKHGEIKKDNYADLTIISKKKNIFKSHMTYTKSDFSPFDGIETNCKITTVIKSGKIYLENDKIINEAFE